MGLIIAGKEYDVPGARVVNWHEHGLTWKLGTSGTRERTEKITQRVHHWTGGEGSEKGVYRTLSARRLSVQLFTRADGVVFQFVDLMTVCAHAGKPSNGRSIGWEKQNVGTGKPNPRVPRERVVEWIHGRKRMVSQFFEAQIKADIAVSKVIGEVLGIPIKVHPDMTVLSVEVLDRWVGDLGHFQITMKKTDPGVNFMRALAR